MIRLAARFVLASLGFWACTQPPSPVKPVVRPTPVKIDTVKKVVIATKPKSLPRIRPITPIKRAVIAPKQVQKPLILTFPKARAYPIPKGFADSMGLLCKSKGIILTGMADTTGSKARSLELSRLRVKNGLAAALKAGCKESQILTRSAGIGKAGTLTVEVWR